MQSKILVIGSLNIDLVISLKRMPAVGETVLGTSLSYSSGGKGANQAAAIGNLGGNAAMLGCVGSDSFGDTLKDTLASYRVDVSRVLTVQTHPTGTAVINVDEKGDNRIIVIPGANTSCNINPLTGDPLFQIFDYILLQMEISPETIYDSITKAKQSNKCVILNPAPAPEHLPDEWYPQLDYITPNETELFKLSAETGNDKAAIERGARKLLSKGVKNVVVTAGESGVFHVCRHGEAWYPARKVKAVDTTAAGDCFNGAFVTALAEGMNNHEAIRFANLAASIAVTRTGAISSLPDRQEVDDLLARDS